MTKFFFLWSFVLVSFVRAQSDTTKPVSNDEFGQQETSIAISHTNPNLIVVGSNDDAMDVRSMPAYVTTDAGKSWDTYRLPKSPVPYGAIGDPVVIADNDGGFYYAYLLFHDATSWYNILVCHSKDGKTWSYNSPVIDTPTTAFEDKEWLAIDRSPTSPTYGRLYVSWTRLHGGKPEIAGTFIAWSDDTGKTWSQEKRIGSFVGTYTLVQVGQHGEVYVCYSQYSEYEDSIGHYMSVSYDFGETFTERLVASFINYPFDLGLARPALKSGRIKSFPYLSFTVDRKLGVLHGVYGSYDTARKAAVQHYISSSDDGDSWSTPRIIGDPTTLHRDRFQPWVTFDNEKGIPHFFYYSSERDEKNLLTSAYHGQIEPDTILTRNLTDTLFNPLLALDFLGDPFLGDYTGADLSARTFAASWTQNRTGYKDGEIFVYVNQNIDLPTGGITMAIKPAQFRIISISPNPMATKSQLRVMSKIAANGSIEVLDLSGRVVATLPAKITEGESVIDLIVPPIEAGAYFFRLRASDESVVEKIVIRP